MGGGWHVAGGHTHVIGGGSRLVAAPPTPPLKPGAFRERHEVFGDVKKLVTEEFVRQK